MPDERIQARHNAAEDERARRAFIARLEARVEHDRKVLKRRLETLQPMSEEDDTGFFPGGKI